MVLPVRLRFAERERSSWTDMINAWLDLPAAALFAVLIVFYALTGALISWLCVCSPLRAKILTMTGVVAPFFGAVSVLFALLTGFLANDVGDRNRCEVGDRADSWP